MLHCLTVAPFLVGVTLGIASEGIGHLCFEHRLTIMGNDAVCRRGGCPIGQRNLCRAIVNVVFGGCLRVARGGVVRTDAAVALCGGIECFYGATESIDNGTAADNRYLLIASACPHHTCLLGLHGAHQAIGKGIGLDVALGGIMQSSGVTTGRMILEFNGIGLACGNLLRTENRAWASHVVVGIAHLVAVEVGSL